MSKKQHNFNLNSKIAQVSKPVELSFQPVADVTKETRGPKVLGFDVPSCEELTKTYGKNTKQLCLDHEQIIEQILEEEEALIANHRQHIDDVVLIVKDEMNLLDQVDQPGSDVEQYVTDLDRILLNKIDIISKLRE